MSSRTSNNASRSSRSGNGSGQAKSNPVRRRARRAANRRINRAARANALVYPPNPVVVAPRAMSTVQVHGAAQIDRSLRKDSMIVVKHREFIATLIATASYTVGNFYINPGRQSLFPWLYPIANCYEFYAFRKLKFEYVPRCSTGTNGSIGMMVDYDAADALAPDEKSFLANEHAVDGPAWAPLCYTAPLDALRRFGAQRYTRSGNVPSGKDIKMYDVGTFQYYAFGATSGTLLGKLWVEYEVEFHTPQPAGEVLTYAMSNNTTGAGGGIGLTTPFGAAATVAGGLPVTVTTNEITSPFTGSWLGHGHGAGTTITSQPTMTGINGSVITLLETVINSAGTEVDWEFLLESSQQQGGMKLDYTGSAATLTGSNLRLAPYLLSI